MITDMFKISERNISQRNAFDLKGIFMRAILSFSSPRCAIVARLNVIYAKFRRAMIAQLNKIWRVGVCACDRTPLTARPA